MNAQVKNVFDWASLLVKAYHSGGRDRLPISYLDALAESLVPFQDPYGSLWDHLGEEGPTHPLKTFDFVGVDNFHSLGRAVYKYTDCGPWMVAVLPGGREVYYDSKEALGITPETELLGIIVGSIVEGSDVGVEGIFVSDPDKFSETVGKVNAKASELWDEANSGEDDA